MIALIVVNYRRSDLTVRLAESVARQTARHFVRLLVVDNSGNEASRAALAPLANLPFHVDLLEERENWGYFGGARRALARLQSERRLPEWIVVSNSDVTFPDREFFQKLNDCRSSQHIGVVAPAIRAGRLEVNQNPHLIRRPSRLRMRTYQWIFHRRATDAAFRALGLIKRGVTGMCVRMISGPATGPREIYAAHGSCFIFSRRYFECGGNLDHPPFLFGEEITVAETCRRLGLAVRYEPGLVVTHARHATLREISNRCVHIYQREASAYCADAFF